MPTTRHSARNVVFARTDVKRNLPADAQGKALKVSQYFGENVFNLLEQRNIKEEIKNLIREGKEISKPQAAEIAKVVLEWAMEKGASHFCHWFQPLTGATAEKHDAFIDFDGSRPIEKLSASQLIQGEPDASSFPNGGTRSTFEARGYTTWDLTSPLFIREATNGKTLCIPTAFVSYHGDALDIKTPLLRSNNAINTHATKFLNLTGNKEVTHVHTTCGCEQEYFLVDKNFYYQREDLVMTGRALVGALTTRNQQLEDHYFSTIPERVLAFMQDVEIELYKMGIPAKTRHNEVAPGQFELAPIFKDSNVAADQNQLVMTILKTIANKHNFVCLLHEKPFAGVNGSGKHLNWSMADSEGRNLLEPGHTPHENHRFLAMVTIICEAVYRHADILRAAIASHSNDHRLGANEAPPSIISVFLGTTITQILDKILSGDVYTPEGRKALDIGAHQLATFFKDNTDRNRTSPFAFTGNKFEFRAVGSSASVGYPLAMLNAVVADVLKETNIYIESELNQGKDIASVLIAVAKKWYGHSKPIVFNGDGYSEAWRNEAKSRGLNNLRTTPEALSTYANHSKIKFLHELGVYTEGELELIYHVALERYVKHREIEFDTLKSLLDRHVVPAAVTYQLELSNLVSGLKEAGVDGHMVVDSLKQLSQLTSELHKKSQSFATAYNDIRSDKLEVKAEKIARDIFERSVEISQLSNKIELMVPDKYWTLPTFFDLLFVR